MGRSGKPKDLSRREFFRGTLRTGAALSVSPVLAELSSPVAPAAHRPDAIRLRVGEPAGPAPLGAPAETCVPFARGRIRNDASFAVFAADGTPVLAQFRPTLYWPDGSVRWLAVVIEPSAGAGDYFLKAGKGPKAPDLVTEVDDSVLIATGEMTLQIRKSGGEWLEILTAPDSTGQARSVISGGGADLVLTRHDGKVFRSSLDGGTRRIVVDERGPVRASVRIQGVTKAEDGSEFFQYILRCTAFRSRSEIKLEVTWLNATEKSSEQVKDIRIVFPFEFDPDRLVVGCATGVYDGPFLEDWPVYVLQEDHDWYWARTRNPDGRVQHLSSGGCNGEHSPGWLYVQNRERCLGVWVPHFWETYPNEIAVKQGELSVGLWPERAIPHLLSKPLLTSNPQHDRPYLMTRYWPILPHPYWAFLDPEKRSLDAKQGMAMTQEIVLSAWAGRGESPAFEAKWWRASLQPVRAHLDPAYVAGTEALGPLRPRDAQRFPELEPLFDESFGWLNRHTDAQKCYGKFDFGDFKYFTPSTTYMTHPGTKWGAMGEMAREGYWHNNEADPLLGMLLYYFRTGDAAAWVRAGLTARHLLDLDLRHHPWYGMYTHSYGHCYVTTGFGGEPDHSWLLGLLVWASVSGDATAWDWLLRCGEHLADLPPAVVGRDTRATSVHLHMMCQFYQYTGHARFRAAAEVSLQALLDHQRETGNWPAYMGNPQKREITGFTDHAMMAIADFHAMTGDPRCLEPLQRAFYYLDSPAGVAESLDVSPLALYALGVLAHKTGESRYRNAVLAGLKKIRSHQNKSADPIGRGDPWAVWGVNNPEKSKGSGRPPQFMEQTRPLSVGFILAYGQTAWALVRSKAREGAG